MINNQATVKMVQNVVDGATPLSIKGYLNSVPVDGIVIFASEVNVPEIAKGVWERLTDFFPYFSGGGCPY